MKTYTIRQQRNKGKRILGWLSLALAIFATQSLTADRVGAARKFVVGYAAMNNRLAPLWLAEEQGFFKNMAWSLKPSFCAAQLNLSQD